MASRLILGIRLCFHNHAPEQAAVLLAFHQPAAHQVWSNDLRWSAEERERQIVKMLGKNLVAVRVAEQQNLLNGVTAGTSTGR